MFRPAFAQRLIIYRTRRERVLAGPGAKPYWKYDTSGASQIIHVTTQNRPTFLQLMARVYSATVVPSCRCIGALLRLHGNWQALSHAALYFPVYAGCVTSECSQPQANGITPHRREQLKSFYVGLPFILP